MIFYDQGADLARLGKLHELHKSGTGKICAGPSVIYKKSCVLKTVFFCVTRKYIFLIGNGIALALRFVVSGETAIERGDLRIRHRCIFHFH